MIKYTYNKKLNKFTENGHTMLEQDVLARLKRLAYLETVHADDKRMSTLDIQTLVAEYTEALRCLKIRFTGHEESETYITMRQEYRACRSVLWRVLNFTPPTPTLPDE